MAIQIAFQDIAAVGGHVGNLSGRDGCPSGKAEFEISHRAELVILIAYLQFYRFCKKFI